MLGFEHSNSVNRRDSALLKISTKLRDELFNEAFDVNYGRIAIKLANAQCNSKCHSYMNPVLT